MTTSLEDLLSYLESVIQQLEQLNREEHSEHENEDLAWERLSQIEGLFYAIVHMNEDRVEGLLRVQKSIAEALQIYGKLYDRQCNSCFPRLY